jgi:hypothetical protein
VRDKFLQEWLDKQDLSQKFEDLFYRDGIFWRYDLVEFEFKIGDIVILKPESAHFLYKNGISFDREKYREIHQKNIKGRVTDTREIKDHYCWGEYACVSWDNGAISECIECHWLQKVE